MCGIMYAILEVILNKWHEISNVNVCLELKDEPWS